MTDNSLTLEQRKEITQKEYTNYKNSFPEVKTQGKQFGLLQLIHDIFHASVT